MVGSLAVVFALSQEEKRAPAVQPRIPGPSLSAIRARADSLQQDAKEARLYGREVTSDVPLDLPSPGSARLRELNWCSDDAQAGYLEAPLCHSPNARARMGERRSATRASREKDSGSSVAPRAAPPTLRHRPPVRNETIGRSTDAAKGRGCWLRE